MSSSNIDVKPQRNFDCYVKHYTKKYKSKKKIIGESGEKYILSHYNCLHCSSIVIKQFCWNEKLIR